MAEWQQHTVMELQEAGVLLVEHGNHGEYRPRPNEFMDAGVAFIRAADMDNGRIRFDSASQINDVACRRITKGIGAAGDVLLSHKGNVGKVALVPDDAPTFVCSPQTTFWRFRDESVLDRRYLYAFLRSPQFHAQLATCSGETDMAPYVSLTSQRALSVAFPPLAEQREIARILGVLDDKIELNRKTNETLEAMARALFKSWFVDFDPVRAKAEGRAPSGMDAETAKLFPSELVESELGPIPKGWPVARLGNLLELKRGYDLPSAQRAHGSVPVVSSSGATGSHHEAKVSGPGLVTGRYGTVGKVFLVQEDFWPLNTTLYLRRLKNATLLFAYQLLVGTNFEKFSDKAAVPGVNRNHLHEEPVVAVPIDLQRRFDEVTTVWEAEITRRERESRTLAATRDALLQPLLSGALTTAFQLADTEVG